MKTYKFLAILAFSATMLMVTSCNKTDEFPVAIDYINDIVGDYEGNFTKSTPTGENNSAFAEVRHFNGNEIQIHCYGELLDTTFVINIYANYDSIMVCATGNDFENIYGHTQSEYHMSHHSNNQNEWMHHMDDNHLDSDTHYGGFNISHHSFNYTFNISGNNSTEIIRFDGIRK